ncbi:MAG: endonuclease/exonuclease/phosphatase family protein [Labilithrix sp.]|nr:endonuclease/exonuclease/phosphatase family protein [Labilithrix sp.]MCW5815325.1 endonuclease/exonuclease/phosphatase family protein [Labilithrix sp.]
MRAVCLAFVVVLAGACGDGGAATPAGGSSGAPSDNASSSSSSGGSSGAPKRDGGTEGGSPPGSAANVRVVAGNLTSGDRPTYDEGPGSRIFKGLRADIALVQELNVGDKSDAALRGWVTETFGADYNYYREAGTGLNIPNGVVSRFPILESGRWPDAPDRGFVYAKLDVPGDRDLWAVSVHLLTANATTRNNSARDLVAKLKEVVKDGEYVIVGGDLNTDTRGETCITTLDEIVDAKGAQPADADGNGNTNAPRGKPYDWVLASPNLAPHQVPTVIGANSFEKGLVFDSRVYTPLADVAPVMATDSSAKNMQHMAVVKDFQL